MKKLVRGALIEYGSDFLGPIPNIVLFQYNPEELNRQFQIQRQSHDNNVPARQTEVFHAHSAPVESFTLTLKFDAADDLDQGSATAELFGVGPRLAALEKMIKPSAQSALLGAVIDAVGDLLGGGDSGATRSVPPERLPRLIFVGGATRVLPVEVKSFSIKETLFNRGLQVIRAEVTIGLEVITLIPASTDLIGAGAIEYMQILKDTQSILNLADAVEGAGDVIPF
ncbi:MAG: hypothetical protein AAFR17_00130 [Pseudomonadota bacterium]